MWILTWGGLVCPKGPTIQSVTIQALMRCGCWSAGRRWRVCIVQPQPLSVTFGSDAAKSEESPEAQGDQ